MRTREETDLLWSVRALCCLCLLVGASSARAEELSRDALMTAYARVKSLRAEIEQTRTSPYLYKPLVSRVQLECAGGRIVWRVLEPFRGEVVFDQSGVASAGGAALPPGAAEKMAPLLRLLRAIFWVDLAAMEKDFHVRIAGDTLEATPRVEAGFGSLRKLLFRFGPDLAPVQITVDAGPDVTELKFLGFVRSPAAASGEAP